MIAPTSNVRCLLPARSSSVRIRDKNLREVGGRSLLERAISTALTAFGAVYVSTDSATYAARASAAGAFVPELRPEHLASSSASIDSAIQHALSWWPDAEDSAVVVLMQATSPFTTPDDLWRVVEALTVAPDARCSLTGVEVSPTTAFVLARGPDGLARRLAPGFRRRRTQDIPLLAVPSGGAYGSRLWRLRKGEPLVADPVALVLVPPERAIDIDEVQDLQRAEAVASAGDASPPSRS